MSLDVIQLNSVDYVPLALLERLKALASRHEVADVLVPSASHVGHAQKAIATRGVGIDTGVMVYTLNSYIAKYWPLITDGAQIATKAQIEAFAARALENAREQHAASAKGESSDSYIYHLSKVGVIADLLMKITPSKTATSAALTKNEKIIVSLARDTLTKLHKAHFITQTEAADLLAHNQNVPLPPLFATGFEQADKNFVRFLKTLAEKISVTYFAPGTETGRILATRFDNTATRTDFNDGQNCDAHFDSINAKSSNGAGQTKDLERVPYIDTRTEELLGSSPLEAADTLEAPIPKKDAASIVKSSSEHGGHPQKNLKILLPRLVFLEPLGPSAEAESIASYLKTYTDAIHNAQDSAQGGVNDQPNTTNPTPQIDRSCLPKSSGSKRALVATTDPQRAWQTLAPKLATTMLVRASWSKPLLSCKPVALFLRFVEQLWDVVESQEEWDAFARRWAGLGEDTPVSPKVLRNISEEYAALPSAWWPPLDIVDFLHSSLSPFEAKDVDAFDAALRSKRDLRPQDLLRELNNIDARFYDERDPQRSTRAQCGECDGNDSFVNERHRELLQTFYSMTEHLLNFNLKGALEAMLVVAAEDNSKEALQGMNQLYSLVLAAATGSTESAKEKSEERFLTKETRGQKERSQEAHRQLALLKAMARNASISYSYQAGPKLNNSSNPLAKQEAPSTKLMHKDAAADMLDAHGSEVRKEASCQATIPKGSSSHTAITRTATAESELLTVTVDIVSYTNAASILPESYDICVLADQSLEAQAARMYLTSVERLINDKLGNAEQVPREIVAAAKNEQLYAIAREYVAFEKPQKTDEGREVYPSPLLSSVEAAFKKLHNASQKNADEKDSNAEKAWKQYKEDLGNTLGPWLQQSEENVYQNYLAQKCAQPPREYPFEKNIHLTGKAKQLLGRAKVPDEATGEAALTDNVRLSPTSLEALHNCPRRWFFERALHTTSINAEMDALAKGTLYHDVLSHVLKSGVRNINGNDEAADLSAHSIALFDEVWTKRFAQAIALAGGAEINLSNKDAAGLGHTNINGLLEDFYKFLPKRLEETQTVRDMDQNLHRLLESGDVFIEGFHPAFFEYSFDSAAEQDKNLSYAGAGQKGFIDRIDIDENGNVIIIDYKSSNKDNLAKYKVTLEEDDSVRTDNYLHPQTFIYAQILKRLKPRLEAELENSALPDALKQRLKQKELRMVGVLYLGVADWQAYYGCAQEGTLSTGFIQGNAGKTITPTPKFDLLVDAFETDLSKLVKEKIDAGFLPPKPLGNGNDACMHCAFKYKCAFNMRKKEDEIEKYEQWSQLAGDSSPQKSPKN